MRFDALAAVLLIPVFAAALLALLPGYRITARLNVLATFATFVSAVSLFAARPQPGPYLLVDDLNSTFSRAVIRYPGNSASSAAANTGISSTAASASNLIAALRGSGRAPAGRPCRSARGCGTEKCR